MLVELVNDIVSDLSHIELIWSITSFGVGSFASVLLLSLPGSSGLFLSFMDAFLDSVFERFRIVLGFDEDLSFRLDFVDPEFGKEWSVSGDYAFIVDLALFEGGARKQLTKMTSMRVSLASALGGWQVG